MNQGKSNPQLKIGRLLILLCITVGLYLFFFSQTNQTSAGDYYMSNFTQDLKEDRIEMVYIKQNAEVPTGVITISFKDTSKKSAMLYVSDINEIQKELDNKNVTYYVKNVSHQMNLVTIILPVVLCSVILVGFMILTTRQMGGGSGSR